MELKWLEDFVSLANTANFSRSADERNITQSAFSRRIKSLEHWVGTELVDRGTFPITLTKPGRSFLEVAQRVVRDLHETRAEIREEHQSGPAMLTFAALHTLSLTFYPSWLRQVEARIGSLSTRLRAESKTMESYLLLLTEGGCDFLLSFAHSFNPVLLDPAIFAYKAVGTERIIPVSLADAGGRPVHSLESKGVVPFLSYAPHSFFGRCLSLEDGLLKPFELQTVYENAMAEGLRAMLLAGYGLAWLPISSIADDLAAGRVVRAGGEALDLVVEIRLYRSLRNRRAKVEQVWAAVDEFAAPGPADRGRLPPAGTRRA